MKIQIFLREPTDPKQATGKPTEEVETLNQLIRLMRDTKEGTAPTVEAVWDLLSELPSGSSVGTSSDRSVVAVLVQGGAGG